MFEDARKYHELFVSLSLNVCTLQSNAKIADTFVSSTCYDAKGCCTGAVSDRNSLASGQGGDQTLLVNGGLAGAVQQPILAKFHSMLADSRHMKMIALENP